MNRTGTFATSTLIVLLGFLIAVTPWYVFPVCEVFGRYVETKTGVFLPMACGYTARSEVAIGGLIMLLGGLLFFSKSTETRRIGGAFGTGLGIVAFLVPTYLVGVCKNPDMPCRLGTEPALILLGAATLAASLVFVLKR